MDPRDVGSRPQGGGRGDHGGEGQGGSGDCTEASALMRAYVDGELAGTDREAYERHLGGCTFCRTASRFEARFKAAVRGHLPRRQTPGQLQQRIRAAVAEVPIAPRRWPWLSYPRLIPAVAVAGALLVVAGMVRGRPSVVFDQARRTYQTELPMDVTGPDCSSVASWFHGRVEFAMHAPRVPDHVTCQGGRLVNVAEQSAAYLVYRDQQGHRMGVLVVDPTTTPIDAPEHRRVGGRDVFFMNGPGISTAAFEVGGLGYVVTSDRGEKSLIDVVQTTFETN